MDTDKIIELASCCESDLYSERRWSFDEEELIAFAQSLLEADREKRKPLTDEEMNDELVKANVYQSVTAFARAVERRVTEKKDDA